MSNNMISKESLDHKMKLAFEKMIKKYQGAMNQGDLQSVATYMSMLNEELSTKTIYEEKGYANRKEYLKSLSEEYGVPYDMVCVAASTLGPNEDFDGLINTLEDYSEGMEDMEFEE